MRKTAPVLLALLLAGCSTLLGPPSPDLSISLYSEAPLPASSVLRVVVDGRRYDLEASAEPGRRSSREVRAPRAGELPVRVELLGPGGTALAAASFSQRYERGSDHWVAAYVGERRPLSVCGLPRAAVPLSPPLSETRADTAFFMYGSLPEGAVC